MTVKYVCYKCDKELKFASEELIKVVEDGERIYEKDQIIHYYNIGMICIDYAYENSPDMWEHECKECNLKNYEDQSYYYERKDNGRLRN